jgi:hypothetical protein
MQSYAVNRIEAPFTAIVKKYPYDPRTCADEKPYLRNSPAQLRRRPVGQKRPSAKEEAQILGSNELGEDVLASIQSQHMAVGL